MAFPNPYLKEWLNFEKGDFTNFIFPSSKELIIGIICIYVELIYSLRIICSRSKEI
jgi:hypothetical protein